MDIHSIAKKYCTKTLRDKKNERLVWWLFVEDLFARERGTLFIKTGLALTIYHAKAKQIINWVHFSYNYWRWSENLFFPERSRLTESTFLHRQIWHINEILESMPNYPKQIAQLTYLNKVQTKKQYWIKRRIS